MKEPVSVRFASVNDAPLLSQLGAKTFYDTFRPYHTEEDMVEYIRKAYDETVIRENLDRSDICYMIGEKDGLPIGYIKLLLNARHELLNEAAVELEKIYVLQEQLGSGAGAQLMNSAIEVSKDKGFHTMFLGVWQENQRAVEFYNRFGFQVFTTRQFQLGSDLCDDYLMKLDLREVN